MIWHAASSMTTMSLFFPLFDLLTFWATFALLYIALAFAKNALRAETSHLRLEKNTVMIKWAAWRVQILGCRWSSAAAAAATATEGTPWGWLGSCPKGLECSRRGEVRLCVTLLPTYCINSADVPCTEISLHDYLERGVDSKLQGCILKRWGSSFIGCSAVSENTAGKRNY